MASHLTITQTTPALPGGKAAGGQQADGGGLMGLFAALLGGTNAGSTGVGATSESQSGFDFSLGNLLKLGTEAGDDADKDSADPDALAAVLAGPAQQVSPATPQPLVDFIDALSALKTSLDAGEPLDPDLLADVETTLNGLADALGLDLDSLAVPEDFSALLEGIDTDKPDLSAILAGLLSPLAQSLADAPAGNTGSGADALLKTIGDKLAAMIAALEKGDIATDKLTSLGMTPGQTPDDEIEAALARFAQSLGSDGTAVPDQPELARPSLEVTEPALTGKAADTGTGKAGATGDDAGKAADTDSDTAEARGAHEARKDAQRREARADAAATAAPAASDASNTPAPSQAQPGQQNAARIDAAANPRIVQAGYQTSQQQLNLPQIAFELGRQVTEGNTRFQIRLDPPELGRIDVRLDIDQSGQVNARLTVEKAETLDLMQRDQRGLERALQQAGLDAGKTNLEFSLKQNPFAGSQQQNQHHASGQDGGFALPGLAPEEPETAPPTVNLYRGSLVASGVNIIA